MTSRTADIAALDAFLRDHPRVFVLTGAGVSTGSGIPGYRDDEARWQRRQPVTHQEFMKSDAVRQRYWARRTGPSGRPGLPRMPRPEPRAR